MASTPSRTDLKLYIRQLEVELEQLKKSEDISAVLLSIARAVSSAKSLSDFYETIHTSLQRLVFVKNFAIGLIDEKNDTLYFPYSHDEKNSQGSIRNISHPDNHHLALCVIKEGKPQFKTREEIQDMANAPLPGHLPSVWVGSPLFIQGKVIGLMVVQDYAEPSRLSHDDVSILMTISDQVALAIERKMNEEVIHESEAKYKDILDNIIEGYYEVDLKGNMIFFNSVLCDILGYTPDELIQMNNRKYVAEEILPQVFHAFNRVFNSGERIEAFECPLVRKNGERFFAEISIALIKTKKNRRVGFRGIVRDISERKKAEIEKKRMEAQLQYAMKMESIGTLAGGIAHNFNNLLMAIRGYSELMLLDLPPDHPHYKMLVNIDKQVTSGSRLTSQLIGYAREGKYEVRPVDFNHLIRETVDTFAMTRKEIRVRFDLSDDISGIIADQGQIEQVLMNLCVNASDAMPGGGGLTFTTRELSHHEFTGERYEPKPGRYVCLTVEDTGCGMDHNVLPHIFEPFFTTKDISSGTGLGLASTYGIIKAHGGYINVRSSKNRGTTFDIFLPVAKEKTVVRDKKDPELIRGDETILFVDDDQVLVNLGEEMLALLGYSPILAESGKLALELYEAHRQDIALVILDMIMPDMAGGDVYDRLKVINPDIRVLLSSGYSIDGRAKDILDRGCNGFIQKPFELTSLSQKIREILDE